MQDNTNDIERYRKDQMSSRERHALEKKALNDPFLEDAIEGSHSISSDDFSVDISEISEKIKGNSSRRRFTPLRIAAGVLLILGIGSMFLLIDLSEPSTIALQKTDTPDSVSKPTTNQVASPSEVQKDLLPAEADQIKSNSVPAEAKRSKNKKQPVKHPLPMATIQAEQSVAKEESEISRNENDGKTGAGFAEAAPAVVMKSESKTDESLAQDKSVELKLKKSDALAVHTISGRVTSADDGSALPGVNVIVKGTSNGVVTNADGYFSISTTISKPELVVSFIGMSTVEIKPNDKTDLAIKMNEDVSQLSEVVVVGYGTANDDREPVTRSAFPEGGIRAYNRYLENSLRYPVEALENNIKGRVSVSFTISSNGALSDFTILKGLGYGCDDEVIRLVKEGPRWNPTTVDNVSVDTEVRVRVKFDPQKERSKKK